ncbi:DUF742 domain-containing protein [Micromonospora sp. WMMD812]|uniref:DUF742 domain-containing protein n=1 Tax=Micromonospora sp. WMMD812 TaxID=3015152 RepID=UPI00248C363A|nr:DUF742 domain-containing protein [Micromonospora sp. WMMD812]WBB66146.1 DUF742 domain-containing protein [Micromonospora sp. WMMD812]
MTPESAGDGPDPEPEVRIRPYLRAPSTPVPGGPADGPGADGPAVPRPFVLTAGRVSAVDPAICLETQVTAAAEGSDAAGPVALLAPELQAIIALCDEPISVAEISARTRLHYGVTRVLVGDLRAAGHLEVHLDQGDGAADPDLILRVIDGLRAIS